MKQLLLLGGGHSHIEVVRRLGSAPAPEAEIVLASAERSLVYSGMLPGLVAGHYAPAECSIDLERLCRRAGITFRQAEATGLDLARRRARFAGGDEHAFDLVSLDVGSRPDAGVSAEGARGVVSARPAHALLASWAEMLSAARDAPGIIAIVGGGAAGVELVLAMRYRLDAEGAAGTRLVLVTDTPAILPTHGAAARRILARELASRDVTLYCGSRVATVETGGLRLADGTRIAANWTVWATSARAPAWLAHSGLRCDADGSVIVDDSLQSVSHPGVFAAGDCARLARLALPKSGVYAVRQGPPLAANLRRAIAGKRLVRYTPQRRVLALIGTGERSAVASWNGFAWRGDWVWRWKERIDRRFVARYA